ncbi:MAG: hypothetical protein JO250_15955 [Armatimonadetes bacterium]|nr:hypothetical protein [Armatimonadota bacterium]
MPATADRDAPADRPRVNAHIHLPPNFTAFETTRQAVALAAEQGVRVLGASNYYDYAVYADFAAEAGARGVFPLFGLEIISLIDALVAQGVKINDPGNPGKMYVCGKGITRFDPMTDTARQLLQVIRGNDSARMREVTDRLRAVFAGVGLEIGLDAEAIKDRVAARHACPRGRVYLQERHVAQAFQEVFFDMVPEDGRAALLERVYGVPPKARPDDAVAVQNEIRSQLLKAGKPAFVPDTFVDFDHAYRLILALGGIPCYPTLADGATPICGYEEDVERLIADIQARGIPAAEFIPIRNTPGVLTRYVRAMRDAGLFVTAGTEHNTLDLLPIAPTCLDGAPIPEDIQEIFWEGACVIAAHQSLTMRGEPGFVDAEGRPSRVYSSPNERIEAFRKVGEAVIAEYQQGCAARGV